MSRANAAPAIPKQMKYITMLEHIVKESERMTPSVERQVAAMGPSWPHGQPPIRQVAANPPMPPPAVNGHSPPVYVRRPGDPVMPVASMHRTMPISRGPAPVGPSDDPFVVRPRTTVNYPQPFSARPSMTQEQLRTIMAGPRPTSTQPMGHYPPHVNGHPVVPPMGPQQVYPAPRTQAPPLNLRVVPPQQLYAQNYNVEPAPLSAPAVSPTFNFGPRANPANAQLLSILNTPSVPRAVPGIGPGALRSVGA
ncbi:hypothetical protein NM688_g9167 [Phlebia brevispora]|uniref:Uncharacterized protein n=1 Tax=Phlebia brevispora TaxID=194682 RepID=A0ACC1RKM9_9APHY|nr:hypothetical protein NM688_g9167 [Phlebia brevispora]